MEKSLSQRVNLGEPRSEIELGEPRPVGEGGIEPKPVSESGEPRSEIELGQ